MKYYNIDDYDFMGDEDFQKFFKSKLSKSKIPMDRFLKLLNRSEREWIESLNFKIMKQERDEAALNNPLIKYY